MRLIRWIGAVAIAVVTGLLAGSAWSIFAAAAANRDDQSLVYIGWLAAAVIALSGLACISDLFATPQPQQETTP